METGDAILTGVKAQGWVSRLIKFGAWVGRYQKDARRFSHVAIVYDVERDGTVMLSEAVARGVENRAFHYAEGDYVHIPMYLSASQKATAKRYMDNVVEANTGYGYFTFAACGINCILAHLRWIPICFTVGTTKICSGYFADMLAHTGYYWRKKNVDTVMPADVWLEFGAKA